MSDWQKARVSFSGVSNNEKYPLIVPNGYKTLLIIALMPIKQYTVFRCLLLLSAKYWFKPSSHFTRIYSSLVTHKTSRERHRTHTPHADTSVLQTLCVNSALRLELTKGTCNQRRTNFACNIVSLDICVEPTKNTRDFAQEWIFYRLLLIAYSFANFTAVLYAFPFCMYVHVCCCCCVGVLRPFDTFKVISGAVSEPINTVPGQGSYAAYQY